jgi:aspartate carbamoyltransferase catalytic subunit
VAGSSIKLWKKLGIDYYTNGPKTVQRNYLTKGKEFENEQKYNVLYNLRIQKERQNKELIPSLEEYNLYFGGRPFDDSIKIMHPGPINRGVEIDSEIADSNQSLILDQVEMGVALRMALIYLLGQKKGA